MSRLPAIAGNSKDVVGGGGGGKGFGVFDMTPHKIAVCQLIQIFAPPAQQSVPFPFHSVAHHNRLGLFLFSLTRACDDFVEPSLEELIIQLKAVDGLVNDWLIEHLMSNLSSLSSPDDLFNFFDKLRGVLATPDGANVEDDQIFLDPSSHLGVFLRCCILAFNLLTFEGVCHLLTNIGTYCNSADSIYELPEEDDSNFEPDYNKFMETVDQDAEDDPFRNYMHEYEAETHTGERSVLQFSASKSIYDPVEEVDTTRPAIVAAATTTKLLIQFFPVAPPNETPLQVNSSQEFLSSHPGSSSFLLIDCFLFSLAFLLSILGLICVLVVLLFVCFSSKLWCKVKDIDSGPQSSESAFFLNNTYRGNDHQGFLRAKWQIEGYLNMQADFLEKDASLFPLNSFNDVLKQIKKVAPELHRVQYLQYLNGLYHDDYLTALDNLHSYFDYSAGMEGIFGRSSVPPSDISLGRYETALLCLGTMHFRFGHSKKALEALTEAVRISQQNNDDSCLAYTLAAVCNLLSEIGISSTTGIIGSPYSLGATTGLGTSLFSQQQLLVLLRRSLKRAESLKLISLVAFNHLALAKFDLKHVRRPLLSFGPKTITKLRTCPINVCKELRLSSHVLSDFGSDGLSQQGEDGAFSTSWLKNLTAVTGPWLKNSQKSRISSVNDYDIFHFGAQPSPVPGSVLQLSGSSYLLRATSWELYGSAPLVRINSLAYITCFADASSSAELSLAYLKLIQYLAVFKGYKEAFVALKLAEEKFLSVSKSRLQLLKLQLLHERALHRGQLKVAQQVSDKFGVLASSVTGVDMEIKTEASLRHARTLLSANQFSQAAAVAHSLFCICYKFNLHVENASVLLLLAEIHKKSGNAVLALPYALAALSFCQSFNLDLLEASAVLALAEIWLSLGATHAKRASNLVHKTLPTILGHGGLELRARANITLAKCYLSDPCFSVSEDPSVVLDPLNQAAEELQILEYHEMAAEAFYLMAVVYNGLGQLEEREEAASSFRKHVMAYENPQYEGDQLLSSL